VRIEGHSFFVIDVQGDLITVTECNLADDPCAIFWDGQYRLSEGGAAVSRVIQGGLTRPHAIESVSRMGL